MAIIRILFGFWYWSFTSLQSRLLSGKIQVRLYTQYFKSYRPPLPSVSVISKQLFYVVKRQYYTSELLFALYCIIVCMIFSRDPWNLSHEYSQKKSKFSKTESVQPIKARYFYHFCRLCCFAKIRDPDFTPQIQKPSYLWDRKL